MSFRRKSLGRLGTLSLSNGPESRNTQEYGTPATLSRQKPGAGVTGWSTFYEFINLDLLHDLEQFLLGVQSWRPL